LLNGVLLIAVAVLFYLHFNSRSESSAVATPGKGSASANVSRRIAYVNTDSLTIQYDFYKDAQKELEEKQKKLDTELGGRMRSLQNEVVDFQKKAPSMTQEQGQRAQQMLMQKQQDLEQYRNQLGQQLMVEQQEKNKEIYETITNYLKKRNATSKYDYVLGYTLGTPTILFASDSLEITKELVAELNKEYQAGKETKK